MTPRFAEVVFDSVPPEAISLPRLRLYLSAAIRVHSSARPCCPGASHEIGTRVGSQSRPHFSPLSVTLRLRRPRGPRDRGCARKRLLARDCFASKNAFLDDLHIARSTHPRK